MLLLQLNRNATVKKRELVPVPMIRARVGSKETSREDWVKGCEEHKSRDNVMTSMKCKETKQPKKR